MFHSISLLKQEVTADSKLRITFTIKDTCFSQDIELVGPRVAESYYETVAIFKVYTSRSLNVVRNLAIYYLTLGEGAEYLLTDVGFFDKHFSTLNYRTRYFKLVKLYYDDYKQVINEYNKEEELIKKALKALQS